MANGYHKSKNLATRQKSYDTGGLGSKSGYKRPGSNKKS